MKTDRMAASADREQWSRRANELRAHLVVSTVVGRVVQLRKVSGAEWIGLCPFHNEKTPSFTVNDKKKFYHCFGCGHHGDAIGFVLARQFGGNKQSFREVVELLESENGLRHLERARPTPPAPKVEQREDLDKLARVARMVEGAKPVVAGDPVDRYLRGRGLVPPTEYLGPIDAALLGPAGWPQALRYDPACWHGLEKRELPAMIAAMRHPAGRLLAVHRTYLKVTGVGVTKAGTERDKAIYGSPIGAWILLGPITDRMTGGEGIETSLSAMQLFKRSGLAFSQRGGMAKMELPFECSDFWYAADRNKWHADPARSRVGEAAAFAGKKLNEIGRKIAVKIPPLPGDGLGDFNDYLQLVLRQREGAIA